MLFDDGLEVDDTEVKIKSKGNQVAVSDLNELLERKYETLKEKLILEMARQAAGKNYVSYSRNTLLPRPVTFGCFNFLAVLVTGSVCMK